MDFFKHKRRAIYKMIMVIAIILMLRIFVYIFGRGQNPYGYEEHTEL